MRIVLYTGKGGVGKTSVAAASAQRAAALGYRTLIISTDNAHSLADSFDRPLAPEPIEIAPNLWAQELDVLHQIDVHWGTIQEWIKSLARWQGIDDIVAEEVTVLPGMEELASLLQIVDLHDSGKYDFIVVDCAPTGETLRLLSFPEVASWWLDRIFPAQRKAANILRPMMKRVMDMPMPGDEVFASIERLLLNLERMRVLLSNSDLASVRLVVNPEKMVIKEAQRTYTYLSLFGYSTDAVIVNRVLGRQESEAELERGFAALTELVEQQAQLPAKQEALAALRHWRAWSGMQRPYLQLIEDSFAPVPILHCPFFDREVVGKEMLERMAASIYGEADPTLIMYQGEGQTLTQEGGEYVLSVPLPLVSKGAVDLTRTGDELVVRIGNQKRNLILPQVLAGTDPSEAKLDGSLRLRFPIHASSPEVDDH